MAEDLNGKIQVQGEIVPDGGATFQPVVKGKYVKGVGQPFQDLAELVAFHPNLMVKGMVIRLIASAPTEPLKIEEYVLMADPADMLVAATLQSLVTVDNFLTYWTLKDETFSNFERVQEYAPDDTNGARPPYPYEDNLPFEANWTPVYDASKNHKWLRFRDDDVDGNMDGVFDNWTLPIALGASISGGDFIANLYTRQALNILVASNQGQLVVTNLGANDSGWFQVLIGDIDHDDGTTVTNLTVGRYFKYVSGDTYTFNNSATANQTLPPPPTTVNSTSNDDGVYTAASGLAAIVYTDDIPAGTDQLWEVLGQKSVYGSLKSDWSIRKILEDPSLTRYAVSFTGLPDSVCSTTEDAGAEPFNTNLNNIGWKDTFQIGTVYLATRTAAGAPPWSAWTIQKIAGESGEYKDRVFKLFPINTDWDTETPPSGADAIAEGWSDTPLQETATDVNGVTESTKFFDQTLKTPWSVPVAYTGQDTFNDLILSDFGSSFKFNVNSATPTLPEPANMTLEAQLYKGIAALWPDETITYVWTRIYNNGAIDTTVADGDTLKNFYYLGTSGTPGDPAYKRFSQRLFVKHEGVDGKAVFECRQTLTLPDATTIEFVEEFVVTDITDGLDAKSLDVNADNQAVFYNVTDVEFSQAEVRLSAFQNNLPTGFSLFWYRETAPNVWTKLVSGVGGYTFGVEVYGSQMQITVATVFTADGSLETERYAVSNIDGDPTLADNITTFVDFISVVKTDSSATAVDGEQAVFGILDNEAHVIVVDQATFDPVAGEIGASGNARSIINLYDGSTRVVEGVGSGKYTVVLASNNANITPAQQVVSNDIEIYVSAWNTGERETKITATISYVTGDARGTIVIDKVFSLNSTLDAAGGLNVIIAGSNGRQDFTPEDRTDITLTAELYNDSKTPALQTPSSYYYSWKVGSGAWETVKAGGGGTNGEVRVITRDNIRVNSLVEVRVFTVSVPSIPNDILRTSSIAVNDVLDGQTFRMYQTDSEPFSKPSAPADTIDVTVGDGSWLPDPVDPIWAVDGTQKPFADWGSPSVPEYTWSEVQQIGGETGTQGDNGGGYYSLYSVYDSGATRPTFPSGNTSTIDQMLAGVGQEAWVTLIPAVDKIWESHRLYQGKTGTSDGVKLDVGGKLVGLDDSPAEPFSGAVWSVPVLISATDGLPGDDGLDGDDGDDGATGLAPEHQWSGTQLRFRNPDTSWGNYVDTKGDDGDDGDGGLAIRTNFGQRYADTSAVYRKSTALLYSTQTQIDNPNPDSNSLVIMHASVQVAAWNQTAANDGHVTIKLYVSGATAGTPGAANTLVSSRSIRIRASGNQSLAQLTVMGFYSLPKGYKVNFRCSVQHSNGNMETLIGTPQVNAGAR